MQIHFVKTSHKQYEKLPKVLRKTTDKQLTFLLENLRHPSLRAKKYDEAIGLWQIRINKDWRLWFLIIGDTYEIQGINKHPK